MIIKYKCVCSYKEFIRGNEYKIHKHDLINPFYKSSAGIVYLYWGDDIAFFCTNDEGKMLYIENNIIVLIRQDIWRDRQINKILNG
jgi:hypothetical protein